MIETISEAKELKPDTFYGGRPVLLPINAAKALHVTVGTLSVWRCKGQGPAFFKAGRAIFYPVEGLTAYADSKLKNNPDAI